MVDCSFTILSDLLLVSPIEFILQIENNAKEALVVLPHEGVLTQDLTKLGVTYKILNIGVLRRKYFTPWGIAGRIFLWAKAIFQLKQLIRKNNIERVYINSANVIIGPRYIS